MLRKAYDAIVVGAGTSGSLLSRNLSLSGLKTLLIEAGPSNLMTPSLSVFERGWIHVPLGYLYTMTMKETSYGYSTDITVVDDIAQTHKSTYKSTYKRTIQYPRGRTLGGSSSINGMIYQKGNAGDYDSWGCEGWDYEAMRHAFDRIEESGMWPCEKQRLSWEILDDFGAAVKEKRGLDIDPKLIDSQNEGVGYFNVNQRKGLRVSAFQAFVDPRYAAMKDEDVRSYNSGNLHVVTGNVVNGLLFDDDEPERVTGVSCWKELSPGVVDDRVSHSFRLKPGGDVVLSAGSVSSPHILMASGIGCGTPTQRVALEGVGENLSDHYQIRQVYKLKEAQSLNPMANSLLGRAKIGLEYGLFQTGPLSMAPSQLGAFLKSDPNLSYPDLQWHVQPLSLDKFGDEKLHPFPGMTAASCNLRPTSRGFVKLNSGSKDVRDAPIIDCNFLDTEHDRRVAAVGMRITRDLVLNSDSMARYEPVEYFPGLAEAQTDLELARAAKRHGSTIFHPVGTCSMGGVVDSNLRVKGVEGLRVCDASVMPFLTSGNTNTPTLAIAENFSRIYLNEKKTI